MKLSVIVPAFNEEKLIGQCLSHVRQAFLANSLSEKSAEVIVVDNNSTDATADLARTAGARVVFEPINQISRARNAGARVAGGDWLLFVDADSNLSPGTLADVLHCIRTRRVAGGGCLIDLDDAPGWVFGVVELWNFISRTCQWAAGSLVFCRRDAFEAVGGFSTDLYAAEELQFSKNVKRWAERHDLGFAILTRHRHISSGRKFRLYSRAELARFILKNALWTPWVIRDRKHLGYFYDGRR